MFWLHEAILLIEKYIIVIASFFKVAIRWYIQYKDYYCIDTFVSEWDTMHTCLSNELQ